MMITGWFGSLENPLTSATDGVDQVWPICSKPVVQLEVSDSVASLQPTFHFSNGVFGPPLPGDTATPKTRRPPRRIDGNTQILLLSAFWKRPAVPSKK